MSASLLDRHVEQHTAAEFRGEARFPHPRAGAWLETLSHLHPRFGGLTAVVPTLCAGLRSRGLDVKLAAFCMPDEVQDKGAALQDGTLVWPTGHLRWLRDGSLRAQLDDAIRAADGVHVHGLWEAGTLFATRAARKLRKPYIVSAHGMLEPWALQQSALKKRLYGAMVERSALQQAACLHALTTAEAQNYRDFGCTSRIAIIPNAVEPPGVVDESLIEHLFPEIAGRRVVLFLGRLHKKKGVELLLAAWRKLRHEFTDAVLVLAGSGEESYVQTLRTYAAEADMQRGILFTGLLAGEAKWSALKRAHAFVLPSYSEGLSVAVLESLCVGTPVVVTHSCHMPEVETSQCGWSVPTSLSDVAQALRESLSSSSGEQMDRSHAARRLAETRFSLRVVSEQMAELYECTLHGEQPRLSECWGAKR